MPCNQIQALLLFFLILYFRRHDFEDIHGGDHGKCNHQGLMSYGNTPTQWSSCSDNDFTTWWKKEGHACLKKTTDKHHGGKLTLLLTSWVGSATLGI